MLLAGAVRRRGPSGRRPCRQVAMSWKGHDARSSAAHHHRRLMIERAQLHGQDTVLIASQVEGRHRAAAIEDARRYGGQANWLASRTLRGKTFECARWQARYRVRSKVQARGQTPQRPVKTAAWTSDVRISGGTQPSSHNAIQSKCGWWLVTVRRRPSASSFRRRRSACNRVF